MQAWIAIDGTTVDAEGVVSGEIPPSVLNHAGYIGLLTPMMVSVNRTIGSTQVCAFVNVYVLIHCINVYVLICFMNVYPYDGLC